ncbi:class I SAM-dependent methyltransferase [Antarcticibacterium arcticum]|uniref:Class I SAM-dependent methyltransferase n=1 Tax=Antarcticibacterium arcticum TaxID=2585771 RepID=A0A5B8YJ12_9FLAO|nr:class I SAM-dependent methyltransferase [Antarcticibacterium arcticum]QED37764.1 class I SAM-dependent methyltransferase [Antarcticibacterium arcticum]
MKIRKTLYKVKRKLLQVIYKSRNNKWKNQKVFKNIYDKNLFHKGEEINEVSRSGPGSDLLQTREIIKQLPVLFQKYSIKTILDIPCGDFYWMKKIDLKGIQYYGGDVVGEIILGNKKFSSNNIEFIQLDIIEDPLPKVDLIICRDLFVHLTNHQIFNAIDNIKKSSSKYLLTTSFKDRMVNNDIALMGKWRPINVEVAPFNFNYPIDEIFENCTEDNMCYNDKYLLLYKIEHL